MRPRILIIRKKLNDGNYVFHNSAKEQRKIKSASRRNFVIFHSSKLGLVASKIKGISVRIKSLYACKQPMLVIASHVVIFFSIVNCIISYS